MSYRDVLAFVTFGHDGAVLAFTEQLVSQFGLKTTFAAVGWKSEAHAFTEAGAGEAADIDLKAEAAQLEVVRSQIAPILARMGRDGSLETSILDLREVRQVVGRRARFADVAVVGRPVEKVLGDVHTPLIEGVLFNSDRPVVIVPPYWRRSPIGRRIAVFWNGSREVAKALAAAAPFLDAAQSVRILAATPAESPDAAMNLLCDNVRRHCADTSLHLIDPGTSTDGMALLEAAAHHNADFIVMGGYGRTRLSEIVFGGVTRETLAGAQLPVLMAH